MKYVVHDESVFVVFNIDRRECLLQDTQVMPDGTNYYEQKNFFLYDILFDILSNLLFPQLRGF